MKYLNFLVYQLLWGLCFLLTGCQPTNLRNPEISPITALFHSNNKALGVPFQSVSTGLVRDGSSVPDTSPYTADLCRRLMVRIDQAIAQADVASAGVAQIPGFPQFRMDRFLASFAGDYPTGKNYEAWLHLLRRRADETRRLELRNLPAATYDEITHLFRGWHSLEQALEFCSMRLMQEDLHAPQRRLELNKHIKIPDSYSAVLRTLGLYFLTRAPFLEGVYRLHRELRASFAIPLEKLPVDGHLVAYAPPKVEEVVDKSRIADILATAAHNPLGIPQPAPPDLDRLFDSFAPIFEVDTVDVSDRIGAVKLDGELQVMIDTEVPVVYRLLSHTRYQGQVLLQLNYVVWFSARPPNGILDIYAGALDGLIWRVTLKADGEPLAYDSIHPCGCYYMIFPARGYAVVQPRDGSEPVLSPGPIASFPYGSRLRLRLSSRTHFLEHVSSGLLPAYTIAYTWQDYTQLLSLPRAGGLGYHSAFDSEGLIANSMRAERTLFWPMGVISAGAMRQWGTHAIAFVGRRHFDDAHLMQSLVRPLDE